MQQSTPFTTRVFLTDEKHYEIMDEQIKQVLEEEAYSPANLQAQHEYLAAALCCWTDECVEMLEHPGVDPEYEGIASETFLDPESLLVSGRLLPFYKFRPMLGSLL